MKSKNIVILYGASIELGWGRSQNLCKGFIEMGHQVCYIEHPFSIRFLFSKRKSPSNKTRDGIKVIKLYGLPVRRLPFLNRLNVVLIKYQIIKTIDHKFLKPDVLWIYDVADINVVNLFSANKKVYDCADDRLARTEEQFGKRQGKYFKKKENLIMENVDHIFVHTERLLKNLQSRVKKDIQSKSSVLNNGVDFDYFYSFNVLRTPIPNAFQGFPLPIIGYIGTITYWIDLDLIAAAAREFPDYSFVLIGPLRNNIGQLFSCKNIFYLESVPYEKVPEYIRAMDVCMLPFRPTESVLNADSLKVLQYFSLGKPVVSTIRLPIKEYADLVWIGSDTRRFSEAIRCALRESHGMAEQRIKIAKNRSWLLICEKALSRLTKAT